SVTSQEIHHLRTIINEPRAFVIHVVALRLAITGSAPMIFDLNLNVIAESVCMASFGKGYSWNTSLVALNSLLSSEDTLPSLVNRSSKMSYARRRFSAVEKWPAVSFKYPRIASGEPL